MWSVYGSLPDVGEYYQIFDDFLDFHIYPWDKHGYDQGQMVPERKNAMRLLLLATNLHDHGQLPENLFDLLEEYNPDKYKSPNNDGGKKERRMRKIKDKKEVGPDSTTKVISNKVTENFDMATRKGFAPTDVVQKTETINKGINPATGNQRFIDVSTRSVFWDVPDEDSINPNNWDWKLYASPEDIRRQEELEKAARRKKTVGRKRIKT